MWEGVDSTIAVPSVGQVGWGDGRGRADGLGAWHRGCNNAWAEIGDEFNARFRSDKSSEAIEFKFKFRHFIFRSSYSNIHIYIVLA